MSQSAKEFGEYLVKLEEEGSKDLIFADFDESSIRDKGKLHFSIIFRRNDCPYSNFILKGYMDYGINSTPEIRIDNFVNNKI